LTANPKRSSHSRTAAPTGARIRPSCPVCREWRIYPLLSVNGRDYWRCDRCGTRFLDPSQLPSAEIEHRHYRLHENDPDDPGYRRFLSKLADPLLERLRESSEGLDYGCGPGPALARMLEKAGHSVALYDPFFFPSPAPLQHRYDFVTCSETAEHFHRPAEEFARLMALLRPGGWLAIMTCFQSDDTRFKDWHYRRDPTHVVFYRAESFRWIAADRGWCCEIPVKDIALLRRPDEPD